MNNRISNWKQDGFTLVELMIVVVIVAIITAVAVPSYRQYVVKSNRAAAEAFILSVANKQEQYILDARAYAGVSSVPGDDTGLATLGFGSSSIPTDVSKNYTIKIGGVTDSPPAYRITAEAIGGQRANDTNCGDVYITSAGEKKASTGATDCW